MMSLEEERGYNKQSHQSLYDLKTCSVRRRGGRTWAEGKVASYKRSWAKELT